MGKKRKEASDEIFFFFLKTKQPESIFAEDLEASPGSEKSSKYLSRPRGPLEGTVGSKIHSPTTSDLRARRMGC